MTHTAKVAHLHGCPATDIRVENQLPEWARADMIVVLNACLADCVDLAMDAKHAHWNVKGSNYSNLHELFGHVHSMAFTHADALADRIVELGGTAIGTTQHVARNSMLSPYPLSTLDWRKHLEALSRSIETFAYAVRIAIERAESAGDRSTATLLAEISRSCDQLLWLIEPHILRVSSSHT